MEDTFVSLVSFEVAIGRMLAGCWKLAGRSFEVAGLGCRVDLDETGLAAVCRRRRLRTTRGELWRRDRCADVLGASRVGSGAGGSINVGASSRYIG